MGSAELKGLSLTIPEQRTAENYYKWIYSAIRQYIGKNVLEIGPGHGNMVTLIKPDCLSYAGLDIDPGVITFLNGKFEGKRNLYFAEGPITAENWRIYLKAHSVDTVVSLNMLEHIENPDAFIKQISAALPGARIILFVPALKWLYGSIDREAGHYTRFSKKDIRLLFKNNNISLEKLDYFNFLGALGWFVSNRILNQKVNSPLSGKLFKLFDGVFIPVLRHFDRYLSVFMGQSVIAVGRIQKTP